VEFGRFCEDFLMDPRIRIGTWGTRLLPGKGLSGWMGDEERVVASAPGVPAPLYVRYGRNPVVKSYSGESLREVGYSAGVRGVRRCALACVFSVELPALPLPAFGPLPGLVRLGKARHRTG
jgi:hypothetical protein